MELSTGRGDPPRFFMRKVILTGGVASGKSLTLRGLSRHLSDLFIFSADDEVALLYGSKLFLKQLQSSFAGLLPSDIESLAPEEIRAVIRKSLFPNRKLRQRLENIIHTYVLDAMDKASFKAIEMRQKVSLAEVPLHYEIGEVISADLVIVVAASRAVQVRRMMEYRRLDDATIHAFLDAQLPIETKVKKADAVIWNDGDPSALECQTLLLANLLNLE